MPFDINLFQINWIYLKKKITIKGNTRLRAS